MIDNDDKNNGKENNAANNIEQNEERVPNTSEAPSGAEGTAPAPDNTTLAAEATPEVDGTNPPASDPEPQPTAPTNNAAPTVTVTVEGVLDFTFGFGITAAETFNRVAEQITTGAPTFYEAMQEKGRPARERLLQRVRSEVFAPAKPVTDDGKNVPGPTADDEIRTLEERVRQLEQQVAPNLTLSAAAATPKTDPILETEMPTSLQTETTPPTMDGETG